MIPVDVPQVEYKMLYCNVCIFMRQPIIPSHKFVWGPRQMLCLSKLTLCIMNGHFLLSPTRSQAVREESKVYIKSIE
jgi:hypothetical protein